MFGVGFKRGKDRGRSAVPKDREPPLLHGKHVEFTDSHTLCCYR